MFHEAGYCNRTDWYTSMILHCNLDHKQKVNLVIKILCFLNYIIKPYSVSDINYENFCTVKNQHCWWQILITCRCYKLSGEFFIGRYWLSGEFWFILVILLSDEFWSVNTSLELALLILYVLVDTNEN